MKLIVGLGNPGKQYEATRHNVGFMALDYYADRHNIEDFKDKQQLQCRIAILKKDGDSILFMKPATFMNESGRAVRVVADYYNLETPNILVVYDELALPFGVIRARQGGESAGHNGIKSIMQTVGDDFIRLRIGIANSHAKDSPDGAEDTRSQQADASDFVLSNFSTQEKEYLPMILSASERNITEFIETGQLEPQTIKVV